MPLTQTQPDAVAQTYAQSLFEVAHTQGGRGKVEEVLGELEDILELARQDAKFSEFLASQVLPVKARSASLGRIFKGRITDTTLNLLLVLNAKDRLAHLPAIASAFDSLAQAQFGRVEIDVFTADPMNPDQTRQVRDRIAQAIGKEVIVHPYTDASMIGGIRLRIGDQLIDGSIATKLRKLRDQLGDQGAARMRAGMSGILEN